MSKHVHRLSSIDGESLRAVCAHCGEVDVRKRGDRSHYVCEKGYQEQKTKYRAQRLGPHGLTPSEAKAYCAGAGKCAVCGSAEKLRVDHCHETGKIRGVLCHNCNTALGLLKDRVSTLAGLIAYLSK